MSLKKLHAYVSFVLLPSGYLFTSCSHACMLLFPSHGQPVMTCALHDLCRHGLTKSTFVIIIARAEASNMVIIDLAFFRFVLRFCISYYMDIIAECLHTRLCSFILCRVPIMSCRIVAHIFSQINDFLVMFATDNSFMTS